MTPDDQAAVLADSVDLRNPNWRGDLQRDLLRALLGVRIDRLPNDHPAALAAVLLPGDRDHTPCAHDATDPDAGGDLAAQDRRAIGSLAAAYRRGYRAGQSDVGDETDVVIVVPDDLAVPAAGTTTEVVRALDPYTAARLLALHDTYHGMNSLEARALAVLIERELTPAAAPAVQDGPETAGGHFGDGDMGPSTVASRANALVYDVLSRFAEVGGGVDAAITVPADTARRWRADAETLADIAAAWPYTPREQGAAEAEQPPIGSTPDLSAMARRVIAASRVLDPEESPQGEALETLGVSFESAAPGSLMDRVARELLAPWSHVESREQGTADAAPERVEMKRQIARTFNDLLDLGHALRHEAREARSKGARLFSRGGRSD